MKKHECSNCHHKHRFSKGQHERNKDKVGKCMKKGCTCGRFLI